MPFPYFATARTPGGAVVAAALLVALAVILGLPLVSAAAPPLPPGLSIPITLASECASAYPVFPDADWWDPSYAHEYTVDYGWLADTDQCRWKCASGTATGYFCDQTCSTLGTVVGTPECPASGPFATYETYCRPPLDIQCKRCKAFTGATETDTLSGGYEFAQYVAEQIQDDHLHTDGSFEHTKLYPSRGVEVRSAIAGHPFTTDPACSNCSVANADFPIRFADLMHQNPWSVLTRRWYGTGKIDLHRSASLGADASDAYLQLSAPNSVLGVCNVELDDDALLTNDHQRGLVFEFYYRQRFTGTSAPTVTVAYGQSYHVNATTARDIEARKTYTLQPTTVWTRVSGFFDYFDSPDGVSWEPLSQHGCVWFDFSAYEGDLLVDEFRIFANMVQHDGWKYANGSTAVRLTDGVVNALDEQFVNVPVHGQEYLTHTVYPRYTKYLQFPPANRAVATLSLEVRGEGVLFVRYGENDGTPPITYHTIIRKRFNTGGAWVHVEAPVTLTAHRSNPTDYPQQFFVTVVPFDTHTDGLSHLFARKIVLAGDDRLCPVDTCTESALRVFVNGRCEACDATAQDAADLIGECTVAQRRTGCTVEHDGFHIACEACPAPTGPGAAGGAFIASEEAGNECAYECATGHWYNATNPEAPTCNACTPPEELRCPAGHYATPCTRTADHRCQPCTVVDAFDASVVYASNGNTSTYDEPETVQCVTQCAPGFFLVDASTAPPFCSACTRGVCGDATSNGNSPRSMGVDIAQYTGACLADADSRCFECLTDDANAVLTDNGATVGEWCAFACIPGSARCRPCGWDALAPVEQLTAQESSAQRVALTDGLVLRFSGNLTLGTTAFGTNFTIRVSVQARDAVGDALVSEWTASVPANHTLVELMPVVTHFENRMDTPVTQFFDVVLDAASDLVADPTYAAWHSAHISTGSVEPYAAYAISSVPDPEQDALHVSVTKQTTQDLAQCCDTRGRTEAAVQRCAPCPEPLRANAWWTTQDTCDWACLTGYELNASAVACVHCPDPGCAVGQVWAAFDAAAPAAQCSSCLACDASTLPANSEFTSAGLVRGNTTSCEHDCIAGGDFYRDPDSGNCSACTPVAQLECGAGDGNFSNGPYFKVACSPFQDAACFVCTACTVAEKVSANCTESTDTVCTACAAVTPLPPNTEWVYQEGDECVWACVAGYDFNENTQECYQCGSTRCPVGSYRTACTTENGYSGCAACNIPARAVATTAGTDFNNSFSCSWECGDASFPYYNHTLQACTENTPLLIAIAAAEVAQETWQEQPPWAPGITAAYPRCTPQTYSAKRTACLQRWGYHWPEPVASPEVDPDDGCPICTACPVIPTNAVFKGRGDCAWVCKHPFVRIEDACYTVPTAV